MTKYQGSNLGRCAGRSAAASAVSTLLALVTLMGVPHAADAAGREVTAAPMRPSADDRQGALRASMRQLWAEHVIWTRGYIVAALAGSPDEADTSSRLLRNQADIGAALASYYGPEVGAKLSQLLKEHILVAADVVAAAKKGDDAKHAEADKRWHDNAAEIAALLSGANPRWSKDALLRMFNDHLALTSKQAVSRLQRKWREDIAAFDEIFTQMMMMADELSDGIIKQFPEKI